MDIYILHICTCTIIKSIAVTKRCGMSLSIHMLCLLACLLSRDTYGYYFTTNSPFPTLVCQDTSAAAD